MEVTLSLNPLKRLLNHNHPKKVTLNHLGCFFVGSLRIIGPSKPGYFEDLTPCVIQVQFVPLEGPLILRVGSFSDLRTRGSMCRICSEDLPPGVFDLPSCSFAALQLVTSNVEMSPGS